MKYAQFAHAGQTLFPGDPGPFYNISFPLTALSLNIESLFYIQVNPQIETDKSSERNLNTPLRIKEKLSGKIKNCTIILYSS